MHAYSTYIHHEKDCVQAIAIKYDGRVFNMENLNPYKFKAVMKELEKYVEGTDEQFYILTREKEFFIPVDHFGFMDEEKNMDCRIDFRSGQYYVNPTRKGTDTFRKKYRALKRLKNLVFNQMTEKKVVV